MLYGKEKSFTYHTQRHESSDFDVVENYNPATPENSTFLIAGVNQDINSERRYSRNNIIYDKVKNEPDKYFPLYSASPRPNNPLIISDIGSSVLKQYKTLHTHNSRMCCSGHWVRSFASGTNANGGGYLFSGTKQQNLPPTTFRALNWFPNETVGQETLPAEGFTCTLENYTTVNCEIKNIQEGSASEERFLNFFGKLELLGIPQVLVETNETVYRSVGDEAIPNPGNHPLLNLTDQEGVPNNEKLPIFNTVQDATRDLDGDGNIDGVVDVVVGSTNYYSAASYDNFQMEFNQLKKVFSEDEFNCCLPTGYTITDLTLPDEACCTGKMKSSDGGDTPANVCCLEDFADVSVYTNRYVSSEGATFNGLEVSDDDIDPLSGYVKPEIVQQLAPTMCCSGVATTGRALNEYFIPIDFQNPSGDQAKTRRWLYISTLDNADEVGGGYTLYNDGLKFNNHVYCAPQSLAGSGGGTGGSGGSGGSGATQN
jgi:hypothetical protein